MMASFNTVNYSLRPSKSIQRQLVFEGVRKLQSQLDLEHMLYIGFGSVWFTDFVMAHKLLGVREMISIEGNEIGYRRALFNAPFATVSVKHGHSSTILPELFVDEALRAKPWLLWLDYDYELNEAIRDDLRAVVENAPANSILIVTFNGAEMRYGQAPERPDRLRDILGSVVPDDLSKKACKDDRMQATLADLTLDFLTSTAADMSRPGAFVPAFRIVYQDSAPMVTAGGVLPAKGAARIVADMVSERNWPCRPEAPIKAPNLTIREAAVLQSQLPCDGPLSRTHVQALGFDLEDHEIEAFRTYYREYPAFAQIVA
jgi:hypothetical protein